MPGLLAILTALKGLVFKLPTTNASDIVVSGASSATVTLNTNGSYLSAISTGTVESGSWVVPTAAAPGAFTIRCHVNSGTNPTGSALDTDLALTSARSWSQGRATAGTTASNVTLTLKNAGLTLKTSTLDISAQTLT